jgi:hypothetical protein
MQLPLEWYIYIIPGSIFLLVLILLLPNKDLKIILKSIKGHSVIVLPIIILFSFFIGLSADRFIHKLYNLILCIIDSKDGLNQIKPNEIYAAMSFTRLLAPSLSLLIFISILKIYKHGKTEINRYISKHGRGIVLIVVSLIVIGIWLQYFDNRNEFVKAKESAGIKTTDTTQSQIIAKDTSTTH